MSWHTLYLSIAPSKYGWRHPRIAKVSKKRPQVPLGQALLKLEIQLPDAVLKPLEVRVEVKPEHIIAPAAAAQSVAP